MTLADFQKDAYIIAYFHAVVKADNKNFVFKYKSCIMSQRAGRGVRLVYGTALEKRWAISIVGSNSTLSARLWRGAGDCYFTMLRNIPAATAVPITPAMFGPIACIRR
jgi:hypothetical protein